MSHLTKVLLVASFLAYGGVALAVSRPVPIDASNYKIERVEVTQYAIGYKGTGLYNGDGYELTKKILSGTQGKYLLSVQVSYDSADRSELALGPGGGINGEAALGDIDRPQFSVDIPVDQSFVDSHKHQKLNGLLKISEVGYTTENVITAPESYRCDYDGDSGAKLDPKCVENPYFAVPTKRKVVAVDFN
jgi:hypothetical protein